MNVPTPGINASLAEAPHFTITLLVNSTEACYGFARCDDGTPAYLPAAAIHMHGLTEEHVGAGFRAHVKPNPRASDSAPPWSVLFPLQFDTDDTIAPLQKEVDVLVERLDELVQLRPLLTETAECAALPAPLREKLGTIIAALGETREFLDATYPVEED